MCSRHLFFWCRQSQALRCHYVNEAFPGMMFSARHIPRLAGHLCWSSTHTSSSKIARFDSAFSTSPSCLWLREQLFPSSLDKRAPFLPTLEDRVANSSTESHSSYRMVDLLSSHRPHWSSREGDRHPTEVHQPEDASYKQMNRECRRLGVWKQIKIHKVCQYVKIEY